MPSEIQAEGVKTSRVSVFISENISALLGFICEGLEALRAPHLTETKESGEHSPNVITEEEEATRATTVDRCDTALWCTVSLHSIVRHDTTSALALLICRELKHKLTYY